MQFNFSLLWDEKVSLLCIQRKSKLLFCNIQTSLTKQQLVKERGLNSYFCTKFVFRFFLDYVFETSKLILTHTVKILSTKRDKKIVSAFDIKNLLSLIQSHSAHVTIPFQLHKISSLISRRIFLGYVATNIDSYLTDFDV